MKPQLNEVKQLPGGSGEADESLFEYLHGEMVNYIMHKNPSTKVIEKITKKTLKKNNFEDFPCVFFHRKVKKIYQNLNGWVLELVIVLLNV